MQLLFGDIKRDFGGSEEDEQYWPRIVGVDRAIVFFRRSVIKREVSKRKKTV